jgi:hypothetical protein
VLSSAPVRVGLRYSPSHTTATTPRWAYVTKSARWATIHGSQRSMPPL